MPVEGTGRQRESASLVEHDRGLEDASVTDQAMSHRLGVILLVASTVPFALSGTFTKLITADLWSVLALRGIIGSALTLAYVRWARGQGPRVPFGWRGWVLASVGTLASIAFLGAFRLTYVANVALIYAMTPFAAAVLGWLILRERVRRGVMVAAAISLAGVAIIVAGGLGAPRLAGDATAVAMTLLAALYLVLIRLFRDTPAVLAGVASSVQLFAIGMIVADPLAMSAPDLARTAIFGASYALGFILWTEGARRVPAAEAGLLGGAETPFAVAFAWLFLAEVPPSATLIGGAVVLGAVIWRAVADARTSPAPR
jgi:drug/metabolite transporter (DMT)-like permease